MIDKNKEDIFMKNNWVIFIKKRFLNVKFEKI